MKKDAFVLHGLSALIACMVVANALLYVRDRSEERHLSSAPSALLRDSRATATLAGIEAYTTNGDHLNLGSKTGAGYVIRYASRHCGYCRRDAPAWKQAATQLAGKGFRIFTLVPSSREAYADHQVIPAGTPQIVDIGMEWVKRLSPMGTPTLLITDPDGLILWQHEGELSDQDLHAAISAAHATHL